MKVPAYTSSPPAATELGRVRGEEKLGRGSQAGAIPCFCAGLECCSPSSGGERSSCLSEKGWAMGAQGCAAPGGSSSAALGGQRLLSSHSSCAAGLALAMALALLPPTSFWPLQLFRGPGLCPVAHQVIHLAHSTVIFCVRLQVRDRAALPVRWTVPAGQRSQGRQPSLQRCRLLLGGETGAAHLAKAVCL